MPSPVAEGEDARTGPDDVRARVIGILADQALVAPAEVRDEASLADLGIGSLGVVECIFAIEEAFGVTVPFNANRPDTTSLDISSVGAVVATVQELVAERP